MFFINPEHLKKEKKKEEEEGEKGQRKLKGCTQLL